MSEEKFDAIIVGGGMAGATAAYILANAGMEVLLADRGDYCGAKNVTGGRLYAHSMEKVFPGFAKEAPVERLVTKEKVSLMTEKGSLDIGYSSTDLGADPDGASYTVLRSKFDQWMAEKCEEAGVMLVPGIRVDSCVVEDGKVVGIDAGGEIMYSDVVILADGVNSLLAQRLGMKQELTPKQVAVGVKEVIQLGEETINQRFGLRGDEGMAWLSAGDATNGAFGGGFLYTNKDTVSIGIVATLADIGYHNISIPELLDRYKEHPAIAPYLEGGESIEYSAHLVPIARKLPRHRLSQREVVLDQQDPARQGSGRLQQGKPVLLCRRAGRELRHEGHEGSQGLPDHPLPQRGLQGPARDGGRYLQETLHCRRQAQHGFHHVRDQFCHCPHQRRAAHQLRFGYHGRNVTGGPAAAS